jgi:hypothetical protein
MKVDDLRERIKPELEPIFGGSMTNLILTKAKMKISGKESGDDERNQCKTFVECLGSDDKLIGMWGSIEVKQRTSRWLEYIG